MSTGTFLAHSFIAILLFACILRAPAQSDASGNWAGQTGVQHVDHTDKRADGSIAAMLINKSPKERSTVKLQIEGAKLAADGTRFDWGQNSPTDKYPVIREPITGIGNSFYVAVSPLTITNIIIPERP